MKALCLLALITTIAFGQTTSAPQLQAESSGKCSPNILSNQGTVQFTCNAAIDKLTAAKIVTLLNRILQQQGSDGEAELNRKLDEILAFLRKEAQMHEPRQLPVDQLDAAKQILSTHATKILILYPTQDSEAYQLATKISDLLVASNWTLKEPVSGAMMMSEGGGPLYGMQIRYRGEKNAPGVRIDWNSSTPWGVLCRILCNLFPEGAVLDPEPGWDADLVLLSVYANPKSKPQATSP